VTWELRLVDAMTGMRSLEDASVDLIITDPPYSSLEKWREMGTTTRLTNSVMSSNEWFPTVPNSYFPDFFAQCYRVLRPGTHCYVMCDEETADAFKPMLVASGFDLRKSVIWHKVGKPEKVNCPNCGAHVLDRHRAGAPGMGYPYRSSYEFILLAQKGKRTPPENRGVRNFFSDIAEVEWIKNPAAYPTEKPVPLVERLIQQSSLEGDLVLDPFAGSGSCGEAAFNLHRHFIGFDVEQKAVDFFERRKQHWIYEDGQETPPMTGTIFDLFGE
jgi:site-specific DNA-methyltransferase (adenine-specific)